MASLGPDDAAGLWACLDPGQVEAVAAEMGQNGTFSDDERRTVLHQLMAEATATEQPNDLAAHSTQRPSGVRLIRQPPFAFLQRADTPLLATALADEHPQTVALVLSHLPASETAQVIERSSAELAGAVIRRLAAIAPASADVVDDVARGLERRIARLRRR